METQFRGSHGHWLLVAELVSATFTALLWITDRSSGCCRPGGYSLRTGTRLSPHPGMRSWPLALLMRQDLVVTFWLALVGLGRGADRTLTILCVSISGWCQNETHTDDAIALRPRVSRRWCSQDLPVLVSSPRC